MKKTIASAIAVIGVAASANAAVITWPGSEIGDEYRDVGNVGWFGDSAEAPRAWTGTVMPAGGEDANGYRDVGPIHISDFAKASRAWRGREYGVIVQDNRVRREFLTFPALRNGVRTLYAMLATSTQGLMSSKYAVGIDPDGADFTSVRDQLRLDQTEPNWKDGILDNGSNEWFRRNGRVMRFHDCVPGATRQGSVQFDMANGEVLTDDARVGGGLLEMGLIQDGSEDRGRRVVNIIRTGHADGVLSAHFLRAVPCDDQEEVETVCGEIGQKSLLLWGGHNGYDDPNTLTTDNGRVPMVFDDYGRAWSAQEWCERGARLQKQEREAREARCRARSRRASSARSETQVFAESTTREPEHRAVTPWSSVQSGGTWVSSYDPSRAFQPGSRSGFAGAPAAERQAPQVRFLAPSSSVQCGGWWTVESDDSQELQASGGRVVFAEAGAPGAERQADPVQSETRSPSAQLVDVGTGSENGSRASRRARRQGQNQSPEESVGRQSQEAWSESPAPAEQQQAPAPAQAPAFASESPSRVESSSAASGNASQGQRGEQVVVERQQPTSAQRSTRKANPAPRAEPAPASRRVARRGRRPGQPRSPVQEPKFGSQAGETVTPRTRGARVRATTAIREPARSPRPVRAIARLGQARLRRSSSMSRIDDVRVEDIRMRGRRGRFLRARGVAAEPKMETRVLFGTDEVSGKPQAAPNLALTSLNQLWENVATW